MSGTGVPAHGVGMTNVLIENTYTCGRESEEVVSLPDPDGDLEDWFDDVVYAETGDGHSCSSTDGSYHEATVLDGPRAGATRSWG